MNTEKEHTEDNRAAPHACPQDKKAYSKVQVALILAMYTIVVLILVIIWLITSGTNPEFASHFSFASTITSIVLSVLAIFMSVSGEVKMQVIRDRLEKEANEIIQTSKKLDSQVNVLSGKMDRLMAETAQLRAEVRHDEETSVSISSGSIGKEWTDISD